MERLNAVPGGISVRSLGCTRSGEMRVTRFLRNAKVTVAEIAMTAAARTSSLVHGRHVLAIQDTTSLRDDGTRNSLNLHAMIAVDASNRALLGLLEARILTRDGTRKDTARKRPYSEKESRRWLDGAREAAKLAGHGATGITVVADRESDIYEDFACRPPEVDLLIRASHDRALADDGGRLFDAVAAAAELGRVHIELPAGPGRAARVACLALRTVPVTIKRPSTRTRDPVTKQALPATVTLTLVEALEIDAPAGCKVAHWRLLTTHTVKTLADARQITEFYRARWTIEQVFRTLKTHGFDVEAVRIADAAAFTKLCTAALIASLQVMQMVQDRDGTAGHTMDLAFEPDDKPIIEAVSQSMEGKTARQKNPHPTGTIAFAAWVCARLGGWTGYYGKPGPIVMYNGLIQFRAIKQGWSLRHHV